MYVIVIGDTKKEYNNLNINLDIFLQNYNVIDVTQM